VLSNVCPHRDRMAAPVRVKGRTPVARLSAFAGMTSRGPASHSPWEKSRCVMRAMGSLYAMKNSCCPMLARMDDFS
jgi:nitrite reductase/ring-hydroxylating ferredoxin subunit